MDEIQQLKNDIVQTEVLLNNEKTRLKEHINEGWLDDMDYVIESNPDYFNQAKQQLYSEQIPEENKINEEPKPKNKFKKIINKIKSIM